MGVTLLLPTHASKRNLLHVEADPLPVQFTGMTGAVGSAPGMPSVGGALGGDWNTAENMPPKDAHYEPRTPTWIRVNGGTAEGLASKACSGFLTLLQPRNTSQNAIEIELLEEVGTFTQGSSGATVQTKIAMSSSSSHTLYLLGDRPGTDPSMKPQLRGLAAVVGWEQSESGALALEHALLVKGSVLGAGSALPFNIHTKYGSNLTLTLRSLQSDTGLEQYTLRAVEMEPARRGQPVIVSLSLPWSTPLPVQVNVWRGAHVWHVANSSKVVNRRAQQPPIVEFEVLRDRDYLIERQCVRSMKAGYGDGKGGWLCNPDRPYVDVEL